MENENHWRGSPLDAGGGIDPYGIKEVVFEFEDGESDVFRPKDRDLFESYELHQMATYMDSIAHEIRKAEKERE
ncbi:MAG: hypothetical protein AB1425_06510 [Actinomycetota bacterium]